MLMQLYKPSNLPRTHTRMSHSLSAKSSRDQVDTKFPPPGKCPSSRRTLSLSSFSSLSSNSSAFSYFLGDDGSPLSPVTPLGLSGVPFSWEEQPGIPKKQSSIRKKDSVSSLLPLPPHPGTLRGCKKFNNAQGGYRKKGITSDRVVQKDPFLAALLECSKDDHQDTSSKTWTGPKVVTRGISDRFGFVNLYISCKRTCAVTESIISVPKS